MKEKQLIKQALKLGVPSDPLFHAIRFGRIVRQPRDYMQRRAVARRTRSTSPYADYIDKRKGYRFFGPDEFPGIMDAVAAARRVYEKKAGNGADAKKPFFFNLLDQLDLDQNPELLTLAKKPAFVEAATGYLGTLPNLSGVGVFVSPANKSMEKSQYYHTDDVDMVQVKCFINVNDVGPDNGPFTFVPGDVSDAVRRKLGHSFRGRRLEDKEVLAECSPGDAVSLIGGPGSGVLVDTSRCLHFGSRCRVGYRLVIMTQYTRHPNLLLGDDKGRRDTTLLIDH